MKPLIRILKACADDNRLRILKMLQHREMCVCELTEALEIAQPSVSRHLKMLEDADLIVHRRDGLWINYRLDPELSNPYVRVILSHLLDWLEDDPEIRSLIQKASGLNREVICRRDTPRSEGSTTQKPNS